LLPLPIKHGSATVVQLRRALPGGRVNRQVAGKINLVASDAGRNLGGRDTASDDLAARDGRDVGPAPPTLIFGRL
jgi:hypothetical protein